MIDLQNEETSQPNYVTIIRKTERLPYEVGATTFYYRRISAKINRDLIAQATEKGQLDIAKLGDFILRYCIVGWSNLADGEGGFVDDIPGDSDEDRDARYGVMSQLTQDMLVDMSEKFREALPDRAALGN